MEAAQPGPVFMIVDCPTVHYVSSLVTNDLFSQHWAEGYKPTPVVMVHLTPLELFQHHPEYTEWRKRFNLIIVIFKLAISAMVSTVVYFFYN